MNTDIHFSKNSDEWETPQDTFNALNREFSFTVDVCATEENAKVPYFFSKEENGLSCSWKGETVWCNPPYSKAKDWVKKASESEAQVVVMLLAARTCTKWFHEYLYQKPNVELRFIKGRLKFGGHSNSAPFPSLIAIIHPLKESK